ncbi:GGDEF domain-containing protein [Azospirillum picis]|uniref:diguanylate cyclase n=1 Tax=Azospirillum picis TaxID=488438 RepID=A0ABU0MFV1_9PROT|nr:GGDEF domain-containing protein [Azospirillum picis]MBP2298638.1 diguanylate cyclase (GGDEF)-like protein [Azospirillum picis]MDQ0532313.1 diguanylate cyclase (GGDEF)-like protein [Azospirillum picis]
MKNKAFIAVIFYALSSFSILLFSYRSINEANSMRPTQLLSLVHYVESLASDVALYRIAGDRIPAQSPGSVSSIIRNTESIKSVRGVFQSLPDELQKDFQSVEEYVSQLHDVLSPEQRQQIGEDLNDSVRLLVGSINYYSNNEVAKQTRELRLYTVISGTLAAIAVLAGGGVLVLVFLLIRKNKELKTLATMDALTALPNRRSAYIQAETLFKLAERSQTEVSVAVVDIDHFKKINDGSGHPAGDMVLQEVARIIARSCRKSDVVARLGGEEFLIIMPDTNNLGANNLCEKVRSSIESAPISYSGTAIPVTVSIGLSTRGSEDRSFEELYKNADKALYVAKDAGRNRVVSAQTYTGLSSLLEQITV